MIRKTAFLVTGTVTGLVAVLSYNPPDLNKAIAATSGQPLDSATPGGVATNSNTVTATPTPVTTTSSTTKARSISVATPSQSPTPVETTKSTGTSGTFQGDTSQTRWGPVQVEITVTDGKITDVSTLQYPSGDRKSMMISSQVIPWLQDEVLKVQSASISGISGATYTSNGFKASLASALQKAGIKI